MMYELNTVPLEQETDVADHSVDEGMESEAVGSESDAVGSESETDETEAEDHDDDEMNESNISPQPQRRSSRVWRPAKKFTIKELGGIPELVEIKIPKR